MSEFGTFETCRLHRAMSEFKVQSGNYLLFPSISHFDPLRTSFDLGQQEQRDALLPSGIRIVLRRECNTIELLSVVAREVARC
jgi:hypothetical protein